MNIFRIISLTLINYFRFEVFDFDNNEFTECILNKQKFYQEASQRKNEGFTGENNGRTIKNRIFARKSGENASKPQKIFSSSLYSWKVCNKSHKYNNMENNNFLKFYH